MKNKKAIQFTVSAEFAHYRRIEGSTTKQTYQIPPRTTIVGMIAAILGYQRDTYYDELSPDALQIGVVVESTINTMQIPQLQLSTQESSDLTYPSSENEKITDFKSVNSKELAQDATRQRYTMEYISEPVYTIYIHHTEKKIMDDLIQSLTQNQFVYSPYLGTTECIARISDAKRVELESINSKNCGVNSIVNAEQINLEKTDGNVYYERVPYDMESEQPGARRTTEFKSIASREEGKEIEISSPNIYKSSTHTIQLL